VTCLLIAPIREKLSPPRADRDTCHCCITVKAVPIVADACARRLCLKAASLSNIRRWRIRGERAITEDNADAGVLIDVIQLRSRAHKSSMKLMRSQGFFV
jgi:hypothetical protein